MKKNIINLKDIFDLEQWENLQDALAHATKMAIVVVNYKGERITKHSECHHFCDCMRKDEIWNKYCQRCDARAGFEAMRNGEPYIYKCYFSIVDIAIPIVVDNTYIGAIMAGQIRVREDGDRLEQILTLPAAAKVEEKRQEFIKYYNELPFLSYGRIRVISNLLYYLCNYICTESAKKQEILDMYETVFRNQLDLEKEEVDLEKKKAPISILDFKTSSRGHEMTSIQEYFGDSYTHYSSIIQKALLYIFENKGEMLSLSAVASHCHVSAGYFSRLFSKEIGESYSSYIPKLKVEWAKTILETTDATITQVSDSLGFSETGYFIKQFKKHTGVTPLVYKKYSKLKRS